MNKEKWDEIKQFYMDNFGISPDLVDLLADNDIITLCASGSSNDSISVSLDIDRSAIDTIILNVFDFTGWKYDLDVNPLNIYNDLAFIKNKGGYPLYKDFRDVVSKKDSTIKDIDIKTMFRLCKLYNSISTRLDREWV
jgi:hypothetical protein